MNVGMCRVFRRMLECMKVCETGLKDVWSRTSERGRMLKMAEWKEEKTNIDSRMFECLDGSGSV